MNGSANNFQGHNVDTTDTQPMDSLGGHATEYLLPIKFS